MSDLDTLVEDCDLHPEKYFRMKWEKTDANQKEKDAGYTLFQIAISKKAGGPGVFYYMGRFGLIPARLNGDLLAEYCDFGHFSVQTQQTTEMLMMRNEIWCQSMPSGP